VDSAARCFIIQGGFTLLGEGDISWAGPVALLITEESMSEGRLNRINPDVVDVSFLEALSTTISFGNGTLIADNMGTSTGTTGTGNNTMGNATDITLPPDPVNPIVTIGGSDNNIPGWSWALVASGIIAFFVALCYLAKNRGEKRGNEAGHFDPHESEAIRSAMHAPIDDDETEVRSAMQAPVDSNDAGTKPWVNVTKSWANVDDAEGYDDPLLPPTSSGQRGVV
jgi:hypothetical protein